MADLPGIRRSNAGKRDACQGARVPGVFGAADASIRVSGYSGAKQSQVGYVGFKSYFKFNK
jgi:hypothetical protein